MRDTGHADVNECRHERRDGKRLSVRVGMRDCPEFGGSHIVIVAAHGVALKAGQTVCRGVVARGRGGCARGLRCLLAPEGTSIERGTGQESDRENDDG